MFQVAKFLLFLLGLGLQLALDWPDAITEANGQVSAQLRSANPGEAGRSGHGLIARIEALAGCWGTRAVSPLHTLR